MPFAAQRATTEWAIDRGPRHRRPDLKGSELETSGVALTDLVSLLGTRARGARGSIIFSAEPSPAAAHPARLLHAEPRDVRNRLPAADALVSLNLGLSPSLDRQRGADQTRWRMPPESSAGHLSAAVRPTSFVANGVVVVLPPPSLQTSSAGSSPGPVALPQ